MAYGVQSLPHCYYSAVIMPQYLLTTTPAGVTVARLPAQTRKEKALLIRSDSL